MSQRKVTLLLPGYTVHQSIHADQGSETPSGLPSNEHAPLHAPLHYRFTEDLERSPWQGQLAQLAGLDTQGGKRLSSARLDLLMPGDENVSTEAASSSEIVRADPISLKPDRDSATLIAADQLALSEDESATLIRSLNDFVAQDGLAFFSRSPTQWYMTGLAADALESFPPSFLASRNASTFLPEGDDAAPWRRLMTEIQMLLHSHPVNTQRQQRGLMPVNSVWFWGGAALPEATAANTDVIFYADEAEVQCLSQHLGISCLPLVQFYTDVVDGLGDEDAVLVDLSIVQAWLNTDAQQLALELARVHEHWLEPLARKVSAGQLEQVRILTEDTLQGLCDEHTTSAVAASLKTGWLERIRGLLGRRGSR